MTDSRSLIAKTKLMILCIYIHVQVWDYYKRAVQDDAKGEKINQDDFVKGMKRMITDPSLKGTLCGPLPLFFHAVDR